VADLGTDFFYIYELNKGTISPAIDTIPSTLDVKIRVHNLGVECLY